ncbi:MAG: carotenoid biosynthesis protein [Bacteroidota bacterium]
MMEGTGTKKVDHWMEKFLDVRKYRFEWSVGILLIFHVVGIVGMLSPWKAWFLAWTPGILLLSTVLLLVNHKDWNPGFLLSMGVALVVGYGVEVAGVKTGVIFGEYGYGETLGAKLWGVPPVMGLIWMMLVYATGVTVQRWKLPMLAKVALAAAMMTALDVVIEPVAIRLDFWHWALETPPLLNYLGWFVVSFVLHFVFQTAQFEKRNRLAGILLIVQLVFFGTLNLLL